MLGRSDLCAYRTPSHRHQCPTPQREHPPPPAPVPSRALAGEPKSGDESSPLQGEPAWLLPKTQMPTMTDPPLHGEWAPAMDRDPEPFLETPRPGERLALQPTSLSASCGCHQLAPYPGQIGCTSPELIFIWFVCSFLVMFYFFLWLYVFSSVKFLLINFTLIDAIWEY